MDSSTPQPTQPALPTWLVVIGFLLVIIPAIGLLSRSAPGAPAQEVGLVLAEPASEQTLSERGIDATIASVTREAGNTSVALTLSNHQYDLSDPAIAGRSTLNGKTASVFEVESSAMGGHHVEGNLVFKGELYGILELGVTNDITLTFTDL